MKRHHIHEIKAIIIFACALILLASFISFVPEDLPWYTSQPNTNVKNWISVFGAYLAGALFFVFGYSSYFLVIFLGFWGWQKLYSRDIRFTLSKGISFITMFWTLSALLSTVKASVVSKFPNTSMAASFTSLS